jgi:myo-inositol-1(or 4)-monophosphatase
VSISVALCFSRRLEIGIVYLPALDQMYTAARGKGAKLNGKEIKVGAEKEG